MERSAGIVRLFRAGAEAGARTGVELEESLTGGGSDGNFTAALGVPTLDGLGAVGEGAHAPHESILVERIADRTALLAKLLAAAGRDVKRVGPGYRIVSRYSPVVASTITEKLLVPTVSPQITRQ